ncbi:NAD-dependent epimerase/dehydratase family protein [Nannocystis sp. SCPEA4]|uniref:NAD-dependent epimerase/dehydratase family protein n=1 Tax=Nannocystis sp. SCPEA4 TaxID=2996787 RepID=UPI00226F63CD|nr:NAD-dependent epimerase/dehydratase family protein [Nannocystis sp. SCPEA4]MCY1056839.1 NAD-dependent epimerase/dehydratase family protein [Nannocystis sp. SCPEA4]
MKVIIFGATGMIGQGVLRECLLDPQIDRVTVVGRSATGQKHPKLRELVHADLEDLAPIAGELAGHEACFYCLGVSSSGMSEAEYTRVTYDLTLKVARPLAELNPNMTFVYISGSGADGSERGRIMWARVKGKIENALRALPFRASFVFRPGFIQPMHGIRSRTRLYNAFYAVLAPLYPLWKLLFPGLVTNTEQLARAMIAVGRDGAAKYILETRDINAIGQRELAARAA